MKVVNPSSQDRTPRRAIVLAPSPAAANYRASGLVLWHKADLGNQADDVRFRGRSTAHSPDSPISENDHRTHPLRTICTTRTVADADQGTPMTDREKILIALREKPLKAFEIMKRVNIKHEDDCQSLLLKMRDEGAVKFDIHKGHWLAA